MQASSRVGFLYVFVFFLLAAFALADGAEADDNSEGIVSGVVADLAADAVTADEVLPSVLFTLMDGLPSREGQNIRLAVDREMPDVKMMLAPILAALPKNGHGNLDGPAVRYALHHHFQRQYGWHVKGLDPLGEQWNKTSPIEVGVMKQLPAKTRAVLAKRLNRTGFDFDDIASLGIAMRYMLHSEIRDRVRDVFIMLDMSLVEPLGKDAPIGRALDMYMAAYLLGTNTSGVSAKYMKSLTNRMDNFYFAWDQTQSYLNGLLAKDIEGHKGDLRFPEAARMIENIVDKFGTWQDWECIDMKKNLMTMEEHDTGRVLLSDFYAMTLNGTPQFKESIPFLRELGSLDETEQGTNRVIIPNYLLGRSNCIAKFAFHEVCCLSECESLLGHIERHFAAPLVDPDEMAAAVAALPSATVKAPRELPGLLLHRLKSIASAHSGLVPIHGRLFAQWMHHAYPRECPYPHLTGTTHPMLGAEFRNATKTASYATNAQIVAAAKQKLRRQGPAHSVPWVYQEENVVAAKRADTGPPPALHSIQCLAAFAAFSLAVLNLGRTFMREGRRLFSFVGIAGDPKRFHSATLDI